MMSNTPLEFDPTILQAFEREIASWPPDQAAAALRIVRAVISGERLEAALDLTAGDAEAMLGRFRSCAVRARGTSS